MATSVKKASSRSAGNFQLIKRGHVAIALLRKMQAMDKLKDAEDKFKIAQSELETTRNNGKEEQRYYDVMVKLKDHMTETQSRTESMQEILNILTNEELSTTEKSFQINNKLDWQ